MTISVRAMQCFVAVCSCGSISAAAARLHLAQPALSLVMRNLEEEMGVTLLQRSSRGVTPTAAGLRMLAHAREILGRIEAARNDVRDDQSVPRGTVALAMSMSIARLLTVPLLQFSLAHWPGVYIKIIEASTGYIPGFVSSGHVDLGLTFSDEGGVDLQFEPVVEEELVLVSPPGTPIDPAVRVDGKPGVTVAQLADLPMVLPGEPHSLRRLLERYQHHQNLRFQVIAEANAIAQLVHLAAAGLAHTIVSLASCRQEAERGEVVVRRIGPQGLRRPVFLCSSSTVPSSIATRAVAEKVKMLLQTH